MDTQNDTKKADVCMACECPCEKHKEHNHQEGLEKEPDGGSSAKVCQVCGSSDKNCGCK